MEKNEKYSSEPHWYVVHTYSGYEQKVKNDLEQKIENRGLQDYIFDIVIPVEEQIIIRNGKTSNHFKKVFPGYVLIKMIVTEETWYIVRNTTGVTGFVGAGTTPIPLTDDEIRKLGFEDAEIYLDYEIGDRVEIIRGNFQGQVGIVKDVNLDAQKAKIEMDAFNRKTIAEVTFDQIQKIKD